MRLSFGAALLAATVLAAPAFAQSTIIPMPAAPQPTASGPPLATGVPDSPLTASDTRFVRRQLEGNLAEIQMAQLALQQSQDQNIRAFAQKMITDHTASQQTLMPIAQGHNIAVPTELNREHMHMLDRLKTMTGPAFDTAYINGMIRAHAEDLKALNDESTNGQSQWLKVWVTNTRPVVMQHYQIAEQIKAELPRTG